jgi:hypothetical protein
MERTANRWLTVILLLCFLAIIGFAAGRQNTTAATSVLVTNTTAQPVPVKLTGTTVPININESTHGKDGLQVLKTFSILANFPNGSGSFDAIPGERFVITNIEVTDGSDDGNYLTHVKASVVDPHGTPVTDADLQISKQNTPITVFSSAHWQGLMYLDPYQHLQISADHQGTTADFIRVTYSGYRVSYP